MLGGIPASRIRIRQMQNLAIKDNFTLAFFNIPDGATLQLVVKDKKWLLLINFSKVNSLLILKYHIIKH